MTIMVTTNRIKSFDPCKSGFRKLLESRGDCQGATDIEFPLTEVLDSNGLKETLWCLRAVKPELVRGLMALITAYLDKAMEAASTASDKASNNPNYYDAAVNASRCYVDATYIAEIYMDVATAYRSTTLANYDTNDLTWNDEYYRESTKANNLVRDAEQIFLDLEAVTDYLELAAANSSVYRPVEPAKALCSIFMTWCSSNS